MGTLFGKYQPAPVKEFPPPEKLSEFKDLAIAPEQFNIPEVPLKRKATDSGFFIALLITLLILWIGIIYSLCYADIRRYVNGYDDCGNICGIKNEHVEGINCSGVDMTQFKYLKYKGIITDETNTDYVEKHCVESCTDNDAAEDMKNENKLLTVLNDMEKKINKTNTDDKNAEVRTEMRKPNHQKVHNEHKQTKNEESRDEIGKEQEIIRKIELKEIIKNKNEETNNTNKIKVGNGENDNEEVLERDIKEEIILKEKEEPEQQKEVTDDNISRRKREYKAKYNTHDKNIDEDEDEDDDDDDVKETQPDYEVIMNRCVIKLEDDILGDEKKRLNKIEDEEILNGLWKTFSENIGKIIGLTAASLVFSIAIVLAFRYATAILVWSVVIGSYVMLAIFFIFIMITGDSWLVSLIVIIIFVVISAFLYATFKRVKLVISIFKEATKAIFSMPLIIVQPVLTFLSLFITVLLFILTIAYIQTAGSLTHLQNNFYGYEPDVIIILTICLDFIMFIWIINFILGCQTMVISGAISSWYFARDKTFLGSPIKDSYYNLLKFHLGSVAFGSLIMMAVSILKAIIRSLAKSRLAKALVSWCMNIVEGILVYICRNAYIAIAMHGEPFMKSGKRAVRLLHANLGDVLTINSVGTFVMFMAKLLIVTLTLLFGYLVLDLEVNDNTKVLAITLLITIFVAHCIFTVFNITIDTIFLCYCEDLAINDGVEHPYYMSTDLMQYFDESRAVLETKTQPV